MNLGPCMAHLRSARSQERTPWRCPPRGAARTTRPPRPRRRLRRCLSPCRRPTAARHAPMAMPSPRAGRWRSRRRPRVGPRARPPAPTCQQHTTRSGFKQNHSRHSSPNRKHNPHVITVPPPLLPFSLHSPPRPLVGKEGAKGPRRVRRRVERPRRPHPARLLPVRHHLHASRRSASGGI